MVDLRLEEANIVVIEEASSWKSVPQSSDFHEEAVLSEWNFLLTNGI